MSARLVFCETQRGVPELYRGWRTPDPSPTRTSAGLPGCAMKAYIEQSNSEDHVPTPRGRSTTKSISTGWASRTPSPFGSCFLDSNMSDYEMSSQVSPWASDPYNNLNTKVSTLPVPSRTPSPSPTRSMWKATWFSQPCNNFPAGASTLVLPSRTPSASPTRSQFPECPYVRKGVEGEDSALAEDDMPTPRMKPSKLSPTFHAPGGNPETSASIQKTKPSKAQKAEKTKSANSVARQGQGDGTMESHSECAAPVVSAGSIGHPFNCAQPCKYAWKKNRGCKDGAACTRCHLCTWKKRNAPKAREASSDNVA